MTSEATIQPVNENITRTADAGLLGTADSAYRSLTVEQAADFLGISRATTYELLAAGELRHIKIGSRTCVPIICLEDFVRSRIN